MYTDRNITKFDDLPNEIKLKFGNQRDKDTPAMFIIASPRECKKQNGSEVGEVIELDFWGDDAFDKGREELDRLSKNKELIIDAVIRYMPTQKINE